MRKKTPWSNNGSTSRRNFLRGSAAALAGARLATGLSATPAVFHAVASDTDEMRASIALSVIDSSIVAELEGETFRLFVPAPASGEGKRLIVASPDKPLLAVESNGALHRLAPSRVAPGDGSILLHGEARVGRAQVSWECEFRGQNGDTFTVQHRLESDHPIRATLIVSTWLGLSGPFVWEVNPIGGGALAFESGFVVSQVSDFDLKPEQFSYEKSRNRFVLRLPEARLGSGAFAFGYSVKIARAMNRLQAKRTFVEHIVESYGLASFGPQPPVYALGTMARRAVQHLQRPQCFKAFGEDKVYFKEASGRDVPDGPFALHNAANPERYDAGFVGWQCIVAKVLWDALDLLGGDQTESLAVRATNALLDFQISDRASPNFGAFFDQWNASASRFCDFNQEQFNWFWSNARISFYLMQIHRRTGRAELKEAALRAIDWVLAKRNADGYWDGDKVDLSGKVCGMANTAINCDAIRALCLAHELTGEQRFLDAAIGIGGYAIRHFVNELHVGDCVQDYQQAEAEWGYGVGMLVAALATLFHKTGERTWYEAAVRCAPWLMAWQYPRTPAWAKTPDGMDITGAVEAEWCPVGGFRFVACHETLEASEAMMELFEADGDERWIHFAVAGLRAVAALQHANGRWSDGAVPESLDERVGTWNNWCWNGWTTAETAHAYIRLMFAIANRAPAAELDWQQLSGVVNGKRFHVPRGAITTFGEHGDRLTLESKDGPGRLSILLSDKPDAALSTAAPTRDLLSGEPVDKLSVRRLAQGVYGGVFLSSSAK